jgi:hypothetical protein
MAGMIAFYFVTQFFIWVICEKENIDWCKAPEWLRGEPTDPFAGTQFGQ